MDTTFTFTRSKAGNNYSVLFPISGIKASVSYSKVTIEHPEENISNNSTQAITASTKNLSSVSKSNISAINKVNATNEVSDKQIFDNTQSYDKESAVIQDITTLTKEGTETLMIFDKDQRLKRKMNTDGLESIYMHKDPNVYSEMIANDINKELSKDVIACVITYVDENGNKFYSENFLGEEVYLGM